MTMLDRMRRHRNSLKWILGLVVLAFILFYAPFFLKSDANGASATDVVADVEGREITAGEFRRTYQNQIQAYRGAYGGNISEQMLKQLGIETQILQQMIDERAALAVADKLGIHASDAELNERIVSMPSLQENGHFIGKDRYLALLRAQRPPIDVAEFEDNLRRSLVVEKLRSALTDWMSVSDAEVEKEFRRRNEKVKLQVVALSADKFRPQVSVSDAEIASHFDSHKNDYRIGEKRKIRFLLLDVEAARAKAGVSPADVERYYNQNIEQYSTPEQIRASHILLKTEGKDEAAVKARAEDVLTQAKSGADFAELAKKYSEDDTNSKTGGDLDYFGRGRMVAEFEQAAFAMEPGQISDLVKTQYGFHIIKLTDKKAASTRKLDEVRPQITEQLSYERAQKAISDMADRLEGQIRSPRDFDRVAKENGLTVQESGYFTKDEPIMGLGPSPEVNARAFEMKEGEVSGALRVARGQAFVTVVDKQAARDAKLDEVKEKVREDLIRQKAKDLASQKAASIAAALKAAPDFEKAAKDAGFEAKPTELIPRDSPLPELGASPAIDAQAFSMPVGAVSGPIATDNGIAIVKVVERKDVTPTELVSAKEQFRTELLGERRNKFFSAYMVKAKKNMKINVNRQTLARIVA
jgi:peptidyl-prolyl cis-trans isomerase D